MRNKKKSTPGDFWTAWTFWGDLFWSHLTWKNECCAGWTSFWLWFLLCPAARIRGFVNSRALNRSVTHCYLLLSSETLTSTKYTSVTSLSLSLVLLSSAAKILTLGKMLPLQFPFSSSSPRSSIQFAALQLWWCCLPCKVWAFLEAAFTHEQLHKGLSYNPQLISKCPMPAVVTSDSLCSTLLTIISCLKGPGVCEKRSPLLSTSLSWGRK